jgi:hypothetical protein
VGQRRDPPPCTCAYWKNNTSSSANLTFVLRTESTSASKADATSTLCCVQGAPNRSNRTGCSKTKDNRNPLRRIAVPRSPRPPQSVALRRRRRRNTFKRCRLRPSRRAFRSSSSRRQRRRGAPSPLSSASFFLSPFSDFLASIELFEVSLPHPIERADSLLVLRALVALHVRGDDKTRGPPRQYNADLAPGDVHFQEGGTGEKRGKTEEMGGYVQLFSTQISERNDRLLLLLSSLLL